MSETLLRVWQFSKRPAIHGSSRNCKYIPPRRTERGPTVRSRVPRKSVVSVTGGARPLTQHRPGTVRLDALRLPAFLAQREVERRALPGPAGGPDGSPVFLDDALGGRQADAGAREFALLVQPLEHGEELAGGGIVESRAVVAHEIDRLAIPLDLCAELHPRGALPAGKLSRVAQQVLQRGAQQRLVAGDG